jgi:conjugal transfer mating pair stabilization protein TraN
MKAFLVLVLIAFQLFAQDERYLEIVKKIKEAGLPDPDYKVSFDDKEWTLEKLDAFVKNAEKRARKKEWTEEEQAFIGSIESAPKKLEFEGTEAEFHPEILANPRAVLDIVSSEEIPIASQSDLRICQESGSFTRDFRQTLEVTLLPLPKFVKRCSGHQEFDEAKVKGVSDKTKREKIADQKVAEIKLKLKNNHFIDKNSISVKKTKDEHKYHIDINIKFQHTDDCTACDNSYEVEISEKIAEKDEWKADEPEEYARIESSPYCKKILVDHLEDEAKEREIDGKKITRDAWVRTVYFQCAPQVGNSPCQELEKQGGQLVKKRCIYKNEETGDCEFWEKTYDLGKRTASHTKFEFENGKKIWGLNWSEIDPDSMNWDKRSDLPKARAMMKLIADMPLGEGANIYNLDENMPIFNGTPHTCNCHLIDELWDCCNDVTALWPAHCDEEEVDLRKMRDEGRCHKVGSYHNKVLKVKVSKTSVFCCYPTKLLKIFNEQARKEMGLSWGTAKKPKCDGFSLDQMDGKIHLDTMDFSDVYDDLQIDEETLKDEMTKKLKVAMEDPTLKNFFLKGSDAQK